MLEHQEEYAVILAFDVKVATMLRVIRTLIRAIITATDRRRRRCRSAEDRREDHAGQYHLPPL